MKDETLFIILLVAVAVLVLLLVIVLLMKLGILGNKTQVNNINRIYVNDGMNVNYTNGSSKNMGLSGFGEDRSDTLVVGVPVGKVHHTIYLTNRNTGAKFVGVLRNRLIVGREKNMTVSDYLSVSDEKSISKKHIELVNQSGIIYVRDLNSTNHTWVNGVFLENERYINNGDIIKMGHGEYIIEIM